MALRSFREGDKVKAVILSIDTEKRRISFGLKPSYFADEDFEQEESEEEDEQEALGVVDDESGDEHPSEEDDDEEDDIGREFHRSLIYIYISHQISAIPKGMRR